MTFIPRWCYITVGLLFFYTQVSSQKPVIDSTVFDRWTSVVSRSLSNDGRYFAYAIYNQEATGESICIRATQDPWERKFVNAYNVSITGDSRFGLVTLSGDSLAVLRLGTTQIQYFKNVRNFELSNAPGNHSVLIQSSRSKDELILVDLVSGRKKIYSDVSAFWWSKDGSTIITKTPAIITKDSGYVLRKIHPDYDSSMELWRGKAMSNLVMNSSGRQIAFVGSTEGTKQHTVWYMDSTIQKPRCLDVMHADLLAAGLNLSDRSLLQFSEDGNKIFLQLQKKSKRKATVIKDVAMDVWSYLDAKINSERAEAHERETVSYACVHHIKNGKTIRLEPDDKSLIFPDQLNPSFLLLKNELEGSGQEWNWNKHSRSSLYLVLAEDGRVQEIFSEINKGNGFPGLNCSPGGKYVLLYNTENKNYYSYRVKDGNVRNITKDISTTWTTLAQYDLPEAPYLAIGTAGWLPNDEAVLLYDQHDIWMVDPDGKRPPVSVTRGYGKKNNMVFRLTFTKQQRWIDDDKKLMASVFNLTNKQNGFFLIRTDGKELPQELVMDDCVYNLDEYSLGSPVDKARDAAMYVVRRESVTESPNYFATKDFRQFSPLTNIRPEAVYNWLKSELHTWQTFDGQELQGVLYKPENFDATRTYPVIMHYYERMSQCLNKYRPPDASDGPINIPYFVSRGYLVFTPDIFFTTGHPGSSALSAVESAARYLSKLSFVDSGRIGIQGHSFGGFTTNYIVSHSSLFAAACSAAGMSDCISDYNLTTHGGLSKQYFYENDQVRIGSTLWQAPELFIENSPVLFADSVKTPLLMMHNKRDQAVLFSQSLEFFLALRRLGKKTWLLQYDEGTHVVSGLSAKDYTIKLEDFFGHYLKQWTAPLWMTGGAEKK